MAHERSEALIEPLDMFPLLENPARETRSQLLSAAITAIIPAVGMRAERFATAQRVRPPFLAATLVPLEGQRRAQRGECAWTHPAWHQHARS